MLSDISQTLKDTYSMVPLARGACRVRFTETEGRTVAAGEGIMGSFRSHGYSFGLAS